MVQKITNVDFGKIKLEELDLTFWKNPFYLYCDEGFVESVPDHKKMLDRSYNIQDRVNPVPEDMPAGHSKYRIGPFTAIHIYYEDLGKPQLNTLARAHEETHALETLNRLDLLTERILQERGVRIPFEKIEDREEIADLGSIYALITRHPRPEEAILQATQEVTSSPYAQELLRTT